MLLLDHFENATFQLKAYFVSQLRKESSDHLSNVLGLIFNILKVGCSGPCFDLSKWEFDCYEIYGMNMRVGIQVFKDVFKDSMKKLKFRIRCWQLMYIGGY